MYLKEIGLHGFKSFPDKVRLEFNKGVTAVVGPNGSGKSNISDAIRWVLGEQRVKMLRGDKMEDVIFAGTDTRKPIGFAEVYITLDNEDGMIPLNYSEITVKRTVFRSGESKYTINGTPCRLKDINELFMDTGVGREGYSIIGQGRIDEILSTKSEDRRRLFEEAAGIAKYRSRRLEAIGKLENEKENLLRVEDIISEIEGTLEPLRIQSQSAKKYLMLKEELKKCEINLFLIDVDKIEDKIAQNENNISITKNDIAQNESKYNTDIELSQTLKDEEKSINALIEKNEELIKYDTEAYQEKTGHIRLLEEQISNFNEKIQKTESDFKSVGLKAEKIQGDINVFKSKESACDIKLNELHNELDKKENEFKKFSDDLNESEEKLNKYKSDVFEKMRDSAVIKTDIENSRIHLKQAQNKKEQLENALSVAKGKLKQADVHMLSVNKMLSENADKLNKYKNILENLNKEKNTVIVSLEKTEAKQKHTLSKYAEAVSRHRVLQDMKNDFDGYYKSVKSVLKEGAKGTLKGIEGAVGELINTEAKYETAIEIALGSAVQNIITSDEYSAKAAIEYLKRSSLGRATFMPVNVINGREIENKNTILNYVGVCGIGSDLVSFNSRYSKIVLSLLGRVIITENMDYAIKVSSLTGRKYRIVTLDGDVINPGGAMTGGSITKKSSGIFGRSREIDELKSFIAQLENDAEDLKSDIKDLSESKKEIEDKINDISLELHKLDLEKNSLAEDVQRAQSAINDYELLVKNNEDEKLFNEKNISETENNIQVMTEKLEKAEAEIEQTDKDIESFRQFIDESKEKRDAIISDITSVKVSISSLEQERNSIRENILRLKTELSEAEKENINYSQLKNEYKEAVKAKEAELKDTEMVISSLKEKIEESQKELKEAVDKRSEISRQIENTSVFIKTGYETISNLKNALFKYETSVENLKNEKDKLFNSVWEQYEITYHQAKEIQDVNTNYSTEEKRAKELRYSIKELGSVNVSSIDEYAKVSERYNFLTTQRDDIKNAEDNLLKIIDDLERLMKEQFANQFGLISQNFNEVFREMFGGGKALLKLSDSNDILESGIDIIVQPPGKTTQNMMLLSGGERALTAIAILFAILKMKPSPFCVLDEIEAALDDANVKRFARYLQRFSGTTQFIVISHRKGTMEAADVLYGVTMQEKGISKVLSVKFDDIKDTEV